MLRQLINAICFRLIHGASSPPASLPPFEIAKLELKPGDYLVLRFQQRLSSATVERLRTHMGDALLLPKGHILVLEGGADLAVITPPPADQAAPQLAAA